MKRKILSFITGILFTLLFISIGLSVALFFRPFYYYEIDRLNIVENSGYSEQEIRENYDALIDYCSPFYQKDLTFPTFPASREGLIHFEEVKDIFNILLSCGFLSFLILLFILYKKKKAEDFHFLRSSALITVILPSLVMLVCSIDFDRTFILFHELFFDNDYWLFSPDTDPVIRILPDTFFLDCAIIIAVIVLIGAALLEISYRLCRAQKHKVK